MRALCVGRHPFLSEHLASVFRRMGLDTRAAVGIDAAIAAAREALPEVVICEFELLAALSLERWEQDELLSRCPVVAVSLTRGPADQLPLDANSIAGCLYLPTLSRDDALRALAGARRVPPYSMGSTALDWPRKPGTAAPR